MTKLATGRQRVNADVCDAVLRLRGLIYHMRGVFFYESAEKVLSYAHLNCVVFNYFYMSLGQVRHTIHLYPRDFMYSNLVISPDEYFLY